MRLPISVLLLLLLAATPSWCENTESLEDDLKDTLYRSCWKACQYQYNNNTSEEAVLSLINDKFDLDSHEEHCTAYNASKECAFKCLASPNHEYYLRPFIRRNYLNDFICVKNYEEFRHHLPCYRNHRSLEFFFNKCGYFALDQQNTLTATQESCAALRCVTRYIPGLIRQSQCTSDDGVDISKTAGDLLEGLVNAFLRERVRLNKMRRLCEENPLLM